MRTCHVRWGSTGLVRIDALPVGALFLPTLPVRAMTSIAQATFDLQNDVVTLDPRTDDIFRYDDVQQAKMREEAPWKRE